MLSPSLSYYQHERGVGVLCATKFVWEGTRRDNDYAELTSKCFVRVVCGVSYPTPRRAEV